MRMGRTKWTSSHWIWTLLISAQLQVASQGQEFYVILDNYPTARARSFPTFEEPDLSPLKEALRGRQENLSEEESAYLAQRNFYFIYFEKLAFERFVVRPAPEEVLGKILAVLRMDQEIDSLLREGRKKSRYEDAHARIETVRKVGRSGKEIAETFRRYLVPESSSSYFFYPPNPRLDDRNFFIHYLIRADTLHKDLSHALTDYFFLRDPRVIDVSENQPESVSVPVLATALVKLSGVAEERLTLAPNDPAISAKSSASRPPE